MHLNNTPGSHSQNGAASTDGGSIRKFSLDLKKKDLNLKSHKPKRDSNNILDVFSLNYVPKKLDFSKNDPEEYFKKRKWSFGHEKEAPPLKLKDFSKFYDKNEEGFYDEIFGLKKKIKTEKEGIENNGTNAIKILEKWGVNHQEGKLKSFAIIKIVSSSFNVLQLEVQCKNTNEIHILEIRKKNRINLDFDDLIISDHMMTIIELWNDQKYDFFLMEHFGYNMLELINDGHVFNDQSVKDFLEIILEQMRKNKYFPNLSQIVLSRDGNLKMLHSAPNSLILQKGFFQNTETNFEDIKSLGNILSTMKMEKNDNNLNELIQLVLNEKIMSFVELDELLQKLH